MSSNVDAAMPFFRERIYDLSEDHEAGKREFKLFAKAVAAADDGFPEPARSFVANERGHFIFEEEILFPFAAKNLTADQWDTLAQHLDIPPGDGQLTLDFVPIRDLLAP